MTQTDPNICDDCGGSASCGCAAYWRDIKEASKNRKVEWRTRVGKVVELKVKKLEVLGFTVVALTEWQYRINGRLDIFWQSQRWHDIRENKRGDYNELVDFVRDYFAARVVRKSGAMDYTAVGDDLEPRDKPWTNRVAVLVVLLVLFGMLCLIFPWDQISSI